MGYSSRTCRFLFVENTIILDPWSVAPSNRTKFSSFVVVRHVGGRMKSVAREASEWFAEPLDFARERLTTLARDSIFGSSTFKSELQFARASVRRF